MTPTEQTSPERLATHDLLATMAADRSLTSFAAAIEATGLKTLLQGPDLLTVLAPANEALAPADATGNQMLDLGKVADMIRQHIFPGALTAAEIATAPALTSLQGQRLPVASGEGGLQVGGGRIIRADTECSNGMLHVVDSLVAG